MGLTLYDPETAPESVRYRLVQVGPGARTNSRPEAGSGVFSLSMFRRMVDERTGQEFCAHHCPVRDRQKKILRYANLLTTSLLNVTSFRELGLHQAYRFFKWIWGNRKTPSMV